jgi:hypothetical protein
MKLHWVVTAAIAVTVGVATWRFQSWANDCYPWQQKRRWPIFLLVIALASLVSWSALGLVLGSVAGVPFAIFMGIAATKSQMEEDTLNAFFTAAAIGMCIGAFFDALYVQGSPDFYSPLGIALVWLNVLPGPGPLWDPFKILKN